MCEQHGLRLGSAWPVSCICRGCRPLSSAAVCVDAVLSEETRQNPMDSLGDCGLRNAAVSVGSVVCQFGSLEPFWCAAKAVRSLLQDPLFF